MADVNQHSGADSGGKPRSRSGSLRRVSETMAKVASNSSLGKAARTSSLGKRLSISGSGNATPVEEEREWVVGGRYAVGRPGVFLYSEPECTNRVSELKHRELVLLLSVNYPGETMSAGPPVGVVVPPAPQSPGWVVLEDTPEDSKGAGTGPVIRIRREGSWEMKGRYSVVNAATLRIAPEITSEVVGELEVGNEVIILEIGLNSAEQGHRIRLRARVSTEDGSLIGWMSPETPSGDRLLDLINLLGPQVVEAHRKSLQGSDSGSSSPGGRKNSWLSGSSGGKDRSNSRDGSQSGGADAAGGPPKPRSSFKMGDAGAAVPWKVGGQYRVLETLPLRYDGVKVADLPPSTIVTVQDVRPPPAAQAYKTGPTAFVVVHQGTDKGRKGWVACNAMPGDGHDLLDSRDQLAYDKVVEKLRSLDVEPTSPADKASTKASKQIDNGAAKLGETKASAAPSQAPGCMAGCLPCSPKAKKQGALLADS